MTHQTQGIILKITDWGETSQLFSIYTQGLGKILAVGQGTKKINSKLNSHLQPLSVTNLMIAQGKKFDKLAGAVTVKNFSGLKNDFKKIIFANFGLELVEKLTQVQQPEERIFNLLRQYLEVLDQNKTVSRKSWFLIKRRFSLELLNLLGYQPAEPATVSDSELNNLLLNHLNQELKTAKFLEKMLLD